MFAKLRLARFASVGLCLGVIAYIASPPAARAGGPQVVRTDQLTKQQFYQQLKTLPDTAVVEAEGPRLTVGEIKAKSAQMHRTVAAKVEAVAREAQAKFAAHQAQFDQQQQAKLQASNAKAMAEVARLRQASGPVARSTQLEVIQQEAAQLFPRSKTASPAEQAQIEQRAGQLLQQLQQSGR